MKRLSIYSDKVVEKGMNKKMPRIHYPLPPETSPIPPDPDQADTHYTVFQVDNDAPDDQDINNIIYKRAYAKIVRNMRMLGYQRGEIAEVLGIKENTVITWLKNNEGFRQAWFEGGPYADGKVARSFYKRAVGYSHPDVKIFYDKEKGIVEAPYTKYYPPDTQAAIMWLINRQPDKWKSINKIDAENAYNNASVPPSVSVTVLGNPPPVNALAGGRVINTSVYNSPAIGSDTGLRSFPELDQSDLGVDYVDIENNDINNNNA